MGNKEIKRSKEYIELRDRLYAIYYYSYVIERLNMPSCLSLYGRAKRIRKSRKLLNQKIQALIVKWNQLTKAECGEEYTLKGIKQAASINGGLKICSCDDKASLLSECTARLSEVMPRPKRKRMTAVKINK